MNVILNITELSSVNFTLRLIEKIKLDFNVDCFIIIVYRDEIKRKIIDIVDKDFNYKIFSQSEISLGDNRELRKDDIRKIQDIENKYSRKTIWEYIYHDRYLLYKRSGFLYEKGTRFSRSKLILTVIKRFVFIENLFNKFRPDLVIYITQDFGTSISTILFEVSKQSETALFIPVISKFKGLFSINNDIYGNWDLLKNRFEENINNKQYLIKPVTKKILQDYIEKSEIAFYAKKQLPIPFTTKIIGKFKTFRNYIIKGYFGKNDYLHISLNKYVFDKCLMFFRKKNINRKKYFSSIAHLKEVDFVYFPLHVEPELVLLVQSQEYIDQIGVIRNISKNLPENIQLFVKDHPAAKGRRKESFYKEISEIPNVVIMENNINSLDLIKTSIGVITIIGSAGQEAFLYGKPVLTLSEAFYNFLPSVNKIKNYEEISDFVSEFKNFVKNENEQLVFLQTLINNSVNVNLLELIENLNQNNLDSEVIKNEELYYDFLFSNIKNKIGDI